MLHHVVPGGAAAESFAPNRGLSVTPEFLGQVIEMLKSRGFDLVNLDEAVNRLAVGRTTPFAVFTLDDGYRDNLVYARPVFHRHGCPFTIYVAPAIADGTCDLWWRGLEQAIAGNTAVTAELDGKPQRIACATDAEKQEAWQRLYWPVRRMEQHRQRQWISAFCASHGVDLARDCREIAMCWDELRLLAADPLCTIGAHTINHYAIRALEAGEALLEMTSSADRIAAETGSRPRHFAFPYGDEGSAGPRDFALAEQAGFTTAVTTRKGLLHRGHKDHLTALPRFSLAGEYQSLRHVKTLLTGLPFALMNRLRAVNVA